MAILILIILFYLDTKVACWLMPAAGIPLLGERSYIPALQGKALRTRGEVTNHYYSQHKSMAKVHERGLQRSSRTARVDSSQLTEHDRKAYMLVQGPNISTSIYPTNIEFMLYGSLEI